MLFFKEKKFSDVPSKKELSEAIQILDLKLRALAERFGYKFVLVASHYCPMRAELTALSENERYLVEDKVGAPLKQEGDHFNIHPTQNEKEIHKAHLNELWEINDMDEDMIIMKNRVTSFVRIYGRTKYNVRP
jgi:hypothetical protein